MNLQQPGGNDALETRNRSRDVVPSSGICTRCLDTCAGNCDVFKASLRGREVIYPGPFGDITAGSDKKYPVDYSHLNIMGYAAGAKAIDEANPDKAIFPVVDTTAVYGHVGIDPGLELDKNGKVSYSPEMERRIRVYKEWQGEFGDVIVQCNVEDWRFGVAEYVVQKLGVETVELKWGQGAKCIGGEVKIRSLERALELQHRGYIITPNPSDPAMQRAYEDGAIKEFERHSRLGFVDHESFLRIVEYLRRTVGAKRVTLKTGAYGFAELAMAIKWSSEARVDLVTIDGSGGGTGMSPWRMMEEWGVPTFYLQCMAHDCAQKLATRGEWVPDLAMAGGFSTEDHIFKALAMGAPYFKAVCLGRALMIPGFVGDNIQAVLSNDPAKSWDALPATVSRFGSTPEEIFVTYSLLRQRFGDRMKDLPLGAVAVHTFIDKLRTGLTQFMAGARSFRLDTVKRQDVVSLTEEATKVSGIKYVMDAYREVADAIMAS